MGLQFYMQAWFDLSTCRDIGWGEGPIPWSEVQSYGYDLGLDPEEMEDLQYMMRSLDTVYFKHREAQRGKSS